MSDFANAARDLAPVLIVGGLIAMAAWTVACILENAANDARVTADLLLTADWDDDGMAPEIDHQRLAQIGEHARAAFEAQMPDRVAQVERIRRQIAENETRRFIEAWDRGEVQP